VDPISRSLNISDRSLANLRPWKPGQSGNPGGRPRKSLVDEVAKAVLEENIDGIKAQMKATLTSNGMAGVLLLKEIFERVGGKVTQGIELSGSVNAMTDDEILSRLASLLNVTLDVNPEIARLPQPDTITTK
jgi:hypothetical protein